MKVRIMSSTQLIHDVTYKLDTVVMQITALPLHPPVSALLIFIQERKSTWHVVEADDDE